jgi:hypothetical protein
MSTYRFLQDAYVNGYYYLAGSSAATADVSPTSTVPNTLPIGWKPNGNVDPLDANAVTAFYALGPQPLGLVRGSFQLVAAPTTYWKATPITGSDAMSYSLTGLGDALTPICM